MWVLSDCNLLSRNVSHRYLISSHLGSSLLSTLLLLRQLLTWEVATSWSYLAFWLLCSYTPPIHYTSCSHGYSLVFILVLACGMIIELGKRRKCWSISLWGSQPSCALCLARVDWHRLDMMVLQSQWLATKRWSVHPFLPKPFGIIINFIRCSLQVWTVRLEVG